MNAAALEQAAYRYLQRFASSEKNLERVLLRKLRRLGPVDDDDRRRVLQAVVKMRQAGLVDDAAYARGVVQSAIHSGKSLFHAKTKLRQKGVAASLIEDAVKDRSEDDELHAAHRYARRRRLGPYRRDLSTRDEERRKDIEKLCRRGFGFGLAAKVIDAAADEGQEVFL